MRVVAGVAGGRRLRAPAGRRIRPTSEQVREAMFNALGSLGSVEGASVLDLFAGTGALGLEAISRGAASADFVETRPASLHALKANVAALHLREKTRIFKKDALPFAEALQAGAYDVCFADPPYESRMLDRLIEIWRQTPFAATLSVEHAVDHELPAGGKRRVFEDTAVTVYTAG
jgi:16S rRNA (guanine966-N2)-methyltransferase